VNEVKFDPKLVASFAVYFIVFALILTSCTHGHCPNPLNKNQKVASKIWIYKYDQSKQCEPNQGVAISEMQKDLNEMKIKVFETKKQYDGLMRIQACGAFTGMANMFLIKSTDLNKATSRGFLQWDF